MNGRRTRTDAPPVGEVRGGGASSPLGRMLPNPAISVLLLVVWLFLVDAVHTRAILLGVIWAVLIPLFTRPFLPARPRVRSWGRLLRFLPLFLWDVLAANVAVARLVLSPWRAARPTWIVIPLDITDAYAITALANVISLTPGTVSAELGPGRTTLLVHVLDTDDPDAEVRKIKTRYEAALKEIFE